AYFVAELWHGATRHTWLLARAAAAAAVAAPAILHLLSRPLCGFVGVESVNPGSQACPALIPEFVLTARSAGLAGVLGLGILFVVRGFLGLDRPGARRRGFGPLLVTAGVAGAGLVLTTFLPDTSLLTLTNVPVEPIALVIALPLGYLALQVLGARDARRFVAGLLVAIVAAFAIFYPNIAALPLPSTIVNAYQGLIPTYLYAFQFPVSTIDRNVETALFTPMLLGLLGALILTSIVVGYSAWTWRITLTARDVVDDDADQAGAFAG
nr:hypothetical protein [Chloroflexota bacterium]